MQHQHQYVEVASGKTKGNMKHKDVQCADCGRMKRMQEDGKMSVMKSGKRDMQGNSDQMDEGANETQKE